MLFAWLGFLDPDAGPVPQEINREASAFLQQPFLRIHSAGPLCDDQARRAGMLLVFEADDRPAAERLVESSPYLKAGLYKTHHLYEYRDETG